MLQAEAAQLKDKLQAEAAQLKEKLQAAYEQNERLLAAQQAAEQQLAAHKASAAQKPSPAPTPPAGTAAAAGASDEGVEHIQHGYSKGGQEHSPADRGNDAACAAGTGAAVGNDEAVEEAAGDGTDGFDFGSDDLPVTQSEAWAAAGAIATQADCDTEDTAQPAMSQPAKLSTAARLQRSKHAQQKQRGQEVDAKAVKAAAVSSRQHTQATGKSPDLQQPGGSTAGTAQMAFKTPYPPVEPEPHTKKGPTTGTTAAAAIAG